MLFITYNWLILLGLKNVIRAFFRLFAPYLLIGRSGRKNFFHLGVMSEFLPIFEARNRWVQRSLKTTRP